jgi:hypothetical protein
MGRHLLLALTAALALAGCADLPSLPTSLSGLGRGHCSAMMAYQHAGGAAGSPDCLRVMAKVTVLRFP